MTQARSRGEPRGVSPAVAAAAGAVAAALITALLAAVSGEVRRWWWLVLAVGLLLVGLELLRVGSRGAVDASAAPATVPPAVRAPAAELPRQQTPETGVDRHLSQRSQLVGEGQIAVSERSPTAPPADLAEQWGPPDARLTPSPDGTVRLERLIAVDAMSVPKSSHAAEENEDAWAADASNGRVALADGASSAFMAREWARILVDDFVRGHELLHGSRRAWLQDATARWASHAGAEGDQWWARDSGARGSAATFLGLSLSHVGDAGSMEFRVAAIGDTCVVQLAQRQGRLQPIVTFPVERAEDFGRHPDLLATVQESRPMPNVRALTGEVGAGDVFLLMTDAVAEWATTGARHDPTVWEQLMAVGPQDFERLVETERVAGRLHDDDTTLIRVVPRASTQRDDQHQLR